MEIKTTPVGWKYIPMTSIDAVRVFKGPGICDSCTNTDFESGAYVAVLNHWLCGKCFKDRESRAKYYPSDVRVETGNLNYVVGLIKKVRIL